MCVEESADWQRRKDSRLETLHWKNKIKSKDVTLLPPQLSWATFRDCLLSNCCFSILVYFIHPPFSLLPSFWGFCLCICLAQWMYCCTFSSSVYFFTKSNNTRHEQGQTQLVLIFRCIASEWCMLSCKCSI